MQETSSQAIHQAAALHATVGGSYTPGRIFSITDLVPLTLLLRAHAMQFGAYQAHLWKADGYTKHQNPTDHMTNSSHDNSGRRPWHQSPCE